MSHTPGPWEREDNIVYALMDDEWLGKPSKCNRVTIGVSFDRRVPQKEREATINLVTSAPDLLAALPDPETLREIANRIFSPNMNSTDREFDLHRLRDMADRAEEAAKKARGNGTAI